MEFRNVKVSANLCDWLISPLAWEMGGDPEGGAVPVRAQIDRAFENEGCRSTLPPSALPGSFPARGEISQVELGADTAGDITPRDALLDRAMGSRWKAKSSEKLRRGRMPAAGLAFVAKDEDGAVIGTVRLWNVAAGGRPALLLGPLAVDSDVKSAGIGSALMRHAITEARRLGHGAIILVGDPAYYIRFGFSADKTDALAMPGPYERHRLLALELQPAALDGAAGTLVATGRKVVRSANRIAA